MRYKLRKRFQQQLNVNSVIVTELQEELEEEIVELQEEITELQEEISRLVTTGTATAVPPGEHATILQITASNFNGLYLISIQANGQHKANFLLTINNVTKFRMFTNYNKRGVNYFIPGHLKINPDDVIKLLVYNTSDEISDYNGTIFGVF